MRHTGPFAPPSWSEMDQRARIGLARLLKEAIPISPGVYALYRHDERMYVGKAASLRERIWKNHCGRGAVMTGSALRRNIAEHLGIASSADIKSRRYAPTGGEIEAVRLWLDGCEIAWIESASPERAGQDEAALKAEYMPLLTKR